MRFLAIMLLLVGATNASAASVSLRAGSRLWLEGDSTLHKFKAEAAEVHATFKLDAASELEAAIRDAQVKGLEVTVPVKKLLSGESGLDENMWKALKAEQQPTISFRLESYRLQPTAPAGALLGVVMHGVLSIAGVQRPVDVEAQAVREATGLRLTGSKTLNMSEFGVQPPVLMMGMIKVKDPIVVRFDLHLQSTE